MLFKKEPLFVEMVTAYVMLKVLSGTTYQNDPDWGLPPYPTMAAMWPSFSLSPGGCYLQKKKKWIILQKACSINTYLNLRGSDHGANHGVDMATDYVLNPPEI